MAATKTVYQLLLLQIKQTIGSFRSSENMLKSNYESVIVFIINALYYMSLVMRKPDFCLCENKDVDQLISAFVFATRLIQFLFFLNPKFQACSHLLWLHKPVCVGPGRTVETKLLVFSCGGSYGTRILVSGIMLYQTCNICCKTW